MSSESNEDERSPRRGRALKTLGIILGVLVGLAVLLIIFGYFLPDEAELVNTSVTLEASSAELFPLCNSRAGQRRMWTRGAERLGITPMHFVDLGGPDEGVGTRIGFFADGRNLGTIGRFLASLVRGRGVILESEPARRVVLEIDFGMVVARRVHHFEPLSEHTTKVSWLETLEISNPLARFLLLLVDTPVNENFDEVLKALGEVAKADRASTGAGSG